MLYRNQLKNRFLARRRHRFLCLERATLAERQGASEDQKYVAKPTQPKNDSSIGFGIKKWVFLLAFFSAKIFAFGDLFDPLKESPYGFYFTDVGVAAEELADFRAIDIKGERFYQQFGELSQVESGIGDFLKKVGNNEPELVARIAFRLAQITHEIMVASKRETAWIHLRASLPTDTYDIPRWHMDGHYFSPPDPEYVICKFALTLVGPSTLFYPVPKELRSIAWSHMLDRNYMEQFCQADQVLAPKTGEGVFFIGGRKSQAALHSEPPIHEKRLFFSMVPCSEKELIQLKRKVLATYPSSKGSLFVPEGSTAPSIRSL